MQQQTSASRSGGGRHRICMAEEERLGRREEGVCEMVVAGEDARGESIQGSRSRQNATPKKETRLTPCTRAHGLWDANVEKEACRHQWHSSWDFQVQALRTCRTCEDAFSVKLVRR